MAKIVDLNGRPIKASPKPKIKPSSSKDIQSIIDHVSYLNQEGRCSGLIVAVLHRDGQKTKAYALDDGTDPDVVIGFLERLKDLIKADLITK